MAFTGVPSMDETMGVMLIGILVASCLLGLSILQSIYYFMHYCQKDPWYLRSFVAVVTVLDMVHQALISHTVYTYLVTHYGQPEFLNQCVWSLLLEVLFNGFIGFLVQCFLALRVWRLSNQNVYLTGLIMVLVLGEFGCVTAFAVIGLAEIRTFEELAHLKTLSITVNSLAAAGDIVIVVSLITLLWFSKTGFKRSDTMIMRLIVFILETGFLTTLFAIASLASILAAPTTFVYIFFFFNIGRLYANSLLATLNVRKIIREAGDKISTSADISFTRILGKNQNGTFGSVQNNRPCTDISIKVDTTKEFVRDGSIHADEESPIKTISDDFGGREHSKYGDSHSDLTIEAQSTISPLPRSRVQN